MISRTGKDNFFVAHYDWLVAGVGVLALLAAGVFFALALGEDREGLAAEKAASIDRMKPKGVEVKAVDMAENLSASRMTRSPQTLTEVSERQESFLASERRVLCKCGKAISGDVKAVPKCPFCGEKQEEEKVVVLDADGDGIPDEFERRYGLNPNDPSDAAADKDGDGFTNMEEYLAKTNPADAKDHPDYLDSLTCSLPLKETYLPFVFTKANQIPGGWRLEFFDASRKDDYGRKGATCTAKIGESIKDYGFVVKGYEQKSVKQAIKGAGSLTKAVDVSEAVIERKSDGKKIKLTIVQDKRNAKPVPVDVQATLVYQRGETKNFNVVPGQEIDLNGSKYKIVEVKAEGKGAKVVVEDSLTSRKRTIQALEQ